MTNEKVRSALRENRVYGWQLADAMGITEFSLSRKFRYELTEEEQDKMVKLIRCINFAREAKSKKDENC